jgi:hypothetical protein
MPAPLGRRRADRLNANEKGGLVQEPAFCPGTVIPMIGAAARIGRDAD